MTVNLTARELAVLVAALKEVERTTKIHKIQGYTKVAKEIAELRAKVEGSV